MNKTEPIDYIARTKAQYAALDYPAYRWVENTDAVPWSSLKKPLSQCRVALICSGGIYKKGQIAFHYEDDISFRIIESDTAQSDLRITHFAYDMTAARNDPNVVFPTQGLKALADEGAVQSGLCLLTGSDSAILKEATMRFPGRRGNAAITDFHLYPLTF